MPKINFSAGPAILPLEVIDQLSEGISNYTEGLSILELSHRGKEYSAINEEAHALVRELLNLPDNYQAFFLWGGATAQFTLIPYNLLPTTGTAGYINTGVWSDKAIAAAQSFGNTQVLASSAEQRFTHIPKDYDIPSDLSYLHITSNNTVHGTQYQQYPDTKVPIVVDMSSDIFSRPFQATDFGLIYASAQKNLGPAGTTLVIINTDLLGKTNREIPAIFDYRSHIKAESRLNTPPVFSIYGCLLMLRWIKNQGLENLYSSNKAKAELLYNFIDQSSLFKGLVDTQDRSMMNVVFKINQADREADFLAYAEANDIVGIKGYRKVGGFRASMYNPMPTTGVQSLIEVMAEYERKMA